MTYKMAKFLIERGRVSGMADKLGVLWLAGALTDEEYYELVGMIPATSAEV